MLNFLVMHARHGYYLIWQHFAYLGTRMVTMEELMEMDKRRQRRRTKNGHLRRRKGRKRRRRGTQPKPDCLVLLFGRCQEEARRHQQHTAQRQEPLDCLVHGARLSDRYRQLRAAARKQRWLAVHVAYRRRTRLDATVLYHAYGHLHCVCLSYKVTGQRLSVDASHTRVR